MSYCTYCETENPDRRIHVSIEEQVVIDGESTGFYSNNFTLCSPKCVEQVLRENSEYDTEHIEEIVQRVAEEDSDDEDDVDLSDVSTRKVGRTYEGPNALAGIEPEKTHYDLKSIQPSFETKNWLYFAGVYGISAWILIAPLVDSPVQIVWALFVIVSMITVLLYSVGGDSQ